MECKLPWREAGPLNHLSRLTIKKSLSHAGATFLLPTTDDTTSDCAVEILLLKKELLPLLIPPLLPLLMPLLLLILELMVPAWDLALTSKLFIALCATIASSSTYICTMKTDYFTEMCSGSEAGSYLRLIDFVYDSTLGLRAIKKKKKNGTPVDRSRVKKKKKSTGRDAPPDQPPPRHNFEQASAHRDRAVGPAPSVAPTSRYSCGHAPPPHGPHRRCAFRAPSGLLKFTVRRPKFNTILSLLRTPTNQHQRQAGAG